MTHEKTLENFATMVEQFGTFEMSGNSARALLAAIKDLQNSNKNLIWRNGLLRERDDLPVDRIPSHRELVRLQQLEASLNACASDEFMGLHRVTVQKWMEEKVALVNQEELVALCSLALLSMETYHDERGVTWTTPTPWAYAKACKALHAQRERANLLELNLARAEQNTIDRLKNILPTDNKNG
jgi:hypothetical protein